MEVCGGSVEGSHRAALPVSYRQALTARAEFRHNVEEYVSAYNPSLVHDINLLMEVC